MRFLKSESTTCSFPHSLPQISEELCTIAVTEPTDRENATVTVAKGLPLDRWFSSLIGWMVG